MSPLYRHILLDRLSNFVIKSTPHGEEDKLADNLQNLLDLDDEELTYEYDHWNIKAPFKEYYTWSAKLKNAEIHFYESQDGEVPPVYTVYDFGLHPGYWSFDGVSRIVLENGKVANFYELAYSIDPAENSFFLIPRSDILDFFAYPRR